ncbi:MAG: hypothetical protein JWL91_187 [Sphingomonas bacterium]|nr:hypothetical protein [Sphingomonas bacterium]
MAHLATTAPVAPVAGLSVDGGSGLAFGWRLPRVQPDCRIPAQAA